MVQELIHAHADERADRVHDHLCAELGVGGISGAAQDQTHIASFVLRELLEGGLHQPWFLLDHGEQCRCILDGVEELEAADRQVDEVVEEITALCDELLFECLLPGVDRREAEDRVLLALELVEERAPGDSDLGAQLLDREPGETRFRGEPASRIGECTRCLPLALFS